MVNNHIAQNYLKNKIENATPIGRILILFEACFRFLDQACDALEMGDKITFVDRNIKAQNIVREFRNSLNLDLNEKIAAGFYRLYNYVLKQLMQSVRTKKAEPIKDARKILDQLYQSWKQAEKQGLGKDIKRYEDRVKTGEATNVRKIRGSSAQYLQTSAGLNIVS
jgi:flagellar protein FliS